MRILIFLLLPLSLFAYPQPNALYNEALGYYEKGDRGNTAYYLKKTLALNPAHREARALYNTIQNEIGGVPLTESPLVLFFIGSANVLPPQGDMLISALLFLAGAVLVVLKLLLKPSLKKRIITPIFVFSALLAAQAWVKYAILFQKDVRVNISSAELLDEGSFEGKVVEKFPAGSEFTVIEKNEDGPYLLARGHNGVQGWVLKEFLPPLWEK